VGGLAVTYLLDTAAWINGVTLPGALPRRIRGLVERADPKGLCSVSLLEAAVPHQLGRFAFKGSLASSSSWGSPRTCACWN
jgi:hypothetical protein